MVQGFTVENWKKKAVFMPVEDSYNINDNLFIVADGVTRDLKTGKAVIKNWKGASDVLCYYPRPSPAREVADICANDVPLRFRDFREKDAGSLRKVMIEVNVGPIRDYNQTKFINSSINYLENDFGGCVAAAAFKKDDYVHWAFVSDCGIVIFNEKGELKFRTTDEGPLKYKKERWASEEMKGLTWEDSEARVITRRDFRNNPDNPYSFGVFTGEEKAKDYIRAETEEIKPGWHLFVYSDGVEKTVYSGDFAEKLRDKDYRGLKKLCQKKVKGEGTLIHFIG